MTDDGRSAFAEELAGAMRAAIGASVLSVAEAFRRPSGAVGYVMWEGTNEMCPSPARPYRTHRERVNRLRAVRADRRAHPERYPTTSMRFRKRLAWEA